MAFPHLRMARRPVRSRVLVFHRVPVEAATRMLPDGLRARVVQGSAVAVLCYTWLGSLAHALLPGGRGSTHHLSYRIAAERDEGPTTWVARRETSSRLGARWNETILRREHGRSSFRLEKDAFSLKLTVESARGEELYLHVELADRTGALFSLPEQVRQFLDQAGEVRPHDVLAPEADAIDARNAFAPEPLHVFELRSAFLDEHLSGTAVVDGAWRLVPRRSQPAREVGARPVPAVVPGTGLPAV